MSRKDNGNRNKADPVIAVFEKTRNAVPISIQEFAHSLGISRGYYHKLLKGGQRVSRDLIEMFFVVYREAQEFDWVCIQHEEIKKLREKLDKNRES